jgi:hypothetical protein
VKDLCIESPSARGAVLPASLGGNEPEKSAQAAYGSAELAVAAMIPVPVADGFSSVADRWLLVVRQAVINKSPASTRQHANRRAFASARQRANRRTDACAAGDNRD